MIKKFESFDTSKDDFNLLKKSVLLKLDSLIEEYDDLSRDVSPRQWRITGHHITDLKKMRQEVENLLPISVEEKENEWVKDARKLK